MHTWQLTHHRTAIAALIGLLAVAACSEPVAVPASESIAARRAGSSEPISIAWQQAASMFVVRNLVGAPPAARVHALLGLAQYAGATDHPRGAAEYDGPGGGHSSDHPSDRGAIAGASAEMLAYLFPSAVDVAAIATLIRQQEAMEVGASSDQFARGEARGRAAALRLIARARTDRFGAAFTGSVPPRADGVWFSSGAALAFPTLGQMQPFLLERGDQFRPGPPPALTSSLYLTDLAEVVAIAANRSDDQIAIAQFWAMSTGTPGPAGHWAGRAAGLIVDAGMGERAAAHVFALVGTAQIDALIGCWDAKYYYWFWRPRHAVPTLTFAPGLAMPNHPSYPSGHSCGSSAAGEVLAAFFPASASALRAEVTEAGRSRVFAGIHFDFDCVVGQNLGRNVANYTLQADRERGILASLR